MSDHVKRFMEAVYPDAPNLATAAFNEEKVLTDAADEISRLRAKLQEIEGYLGGGKDNAVQAARMVVDELNEKRAQLERAREALEDIENADANTDVWKIAHSTLRELENGGGK